MDNVILPVQARDPAWEQVRVQDPERMRYPEQDQAWVPVRGPVQAWDPEWGRGQE